jgi:hypothetical protein
MADNPYAARPQGAATDKRYEKCPIDMPRGDSDADKAARMRFWIERGNANLNAAGKHHLEWCGKDGHYWIAERA